MKPQIPRTDSIGELAQFWDTHDVTEFDEQMEEVPTPVFERQAGNVVRVSLSDDEHRAVRQIAASRGLKEAALIHEWVKEKLHQS